MNSQIPQQPSLAQNFFENRKRIFWFLHLGGWFGYTISQVTGALIHGKPFIYLWLIVLATATGIILTLLLRYVLAKIWNRPAVIRIVVSLTLVIVFTGAWTVLQQIAYWEIIKHGYRPDNIFSWFYNSTANLAIFLCWAGLYFGIKYYQMLQTQTQQTLKATSLAHLAQLKMLRYQLNPHFLFNTLNAISTLILEKNSESANNMVTRLADFLRYSLDNDPIKTVDLDQELHALGLYLSIEKVRFEDALRLSFDIDEKAKLALVPNLLLQPLIENSVKYAVANNENGGTILISAKIFGSDLLLEVCDDGPGLNASDNTNHRRNGVGINNIRGRLEQLYPNKHSFTLGKADIGGLKVSIRIPLQLPEENERLHP